MKFQKSKTEEYFSTEGLISILAEMEPLKQAVDINVEIEFKDAVVKVKGRLWGHFHEQEMTHDMPQYSDLYDVGIELNEVMISYSSEYFEKRVRSLMLN